MNMVIVGEIVAGILVLAAAVRFAVRDYRERNGASPQQGVESEDTVETPARNREHEADQNPSADPKLGAEQNLSDVGSAESS
jgi:hypothetical protein